MVVLLIALVTLSGVLFYIHILVFRHYYTTQDLGFFFYFLQEEKIVRILVKILKVPRAALIQIEFLVYIKIIWECQLAEPYGSSIFRNELNFDGWVKLV